MAGLLAALDRALHLHPEKTFIYYGQTEISYEQLHEQSDRLATALLQKGIEPGDTIGVNALNQPEWLYTFFAAAKIGAVVVALNPRYRTAELDYMLNNSACKMVVSLGELNGFDYLAMFAGMRDRLPTVEHYVYIGAEADRGVPFAELLAQAADREKVGARRRRGAETDPLIMIYTSGTTGQPKGTVITHRSMSSSARAQAEHLHFTPEERIVCSLPLNHVGGITCAIAAALISRASIILIPSFRPDLVLEAAARLQPTVFAGVPTMYLMLLDCSGSEQYDFSSVRYTIVGGSNVEPELVGRMQARMPQSQFINLYGLSETSGACILSPLQDDPQYLATSLGVAIGDFQLRVVDGERQELASGEIGELAVKGACLAAGYYGRPQESAEAFDSDGWLYTGDLASLDEAGRVFFKGRKKEMYVNGGYNVYPIEIENVLVAHPKVAIAAGIGVPHELYGEVGHYFIIPAPGESPTAEELQAYCRTRLADYKLPHSFDIVAELPLTPAGKVQKALLKQRYAQNRKGGQRDERDRLLADETR